MERRVAALEIGIGADSSSERRGEKVDWDSPLAKKEMPRRALTLLELFAGHFGVV